MRACKLSTIALVALLFCLTICAALSANIWLSKWTDKAKGNNTLRMDQIHDMNIYSALGLTQGQ
jgi:hypothetical protein